MNNRSMLLAAALASAFTANLSFCQQAVKAAETVIKRLSGQELAEYRKKLASLRTMPGSELVGGITWVGGSSAGGSYRVVTYSRIEPRGADAPHDHLASMTYKDLPSAVRGYENMQADFTKTHPTKSWIGAVDEWGTNVAVGKTIVSRIIASVSKNVTRR